ncbi:MAG: hypothetical protein Q8Q29_07860 [Actinomycetota bacterium]|nr:hypothetical protein [Actinomycetota bacterium]
MPEDIDRLVTVGGSRSPSDSYTDAVEDDVTRITAIVGQPDFTYRAQMVPKGRGIRELGTRLSWSGTAYWSYPRRPATRVPL